MNVDCLWPYACILVGCGLFALGIIILKLLANSKSWPRTSGVILESSVQPGSFRIGGSFNYIVSPKVSYEYQVKGRKYVSSRLALIERNSASENLARRKAEKFAPGQQVDVYYDPKKPESATLTVGDPTEGKFPNGMIVIGVLLMICGGVWLWWTST